MSVAVSKRGGDGLALDGSPWRRLVLAEGPVNQRGKAAVVAVAAAKAELEDRVASNPDDYASLVLLGEINLRIGLVSAAQACLFRATCLPPPSWAAYQYTSFLLRQAEDRLRDSFFRGTGAPPPSFSWVGRFVTAVLSGGRGQYLRWRGRA